MPAAAAALLFAAQLAWVPLPSHLPPLAVKLCASSELRRASELQLALGQGTWEIEAVTARSLEGVASFFVASYWMASTTFGKVKLSGREQKLLERRMRDDFRTRYGSSWEGAADTRLFRTQLLLARDLRTRSIVGCVGTEAALFDPLTGCVLPSAQVQVAHACLLARTPATLPASAHLRLTSRVVPAAQAEAVMRLELDAMDEEERARTAELYGSGGVAALAAELLPEYTPLALLANLAVAPKLRRTGLARELCDCCEVGCATWALPGMLLQVEEANTAAAALYEALGYERIHRDADAFALRLSPGAGSLASALLLSENEELLQPVQSELVTMAKQVSISSAE